MEQRRARSWQERLQGMLFVAALLFWGDSGAQIRYSVLEEGKDGAVVGNIAKDLGVDPRSLSERGLRIASSLSESLLQVNQHDGSLFLGSKIDREEVCEHSSVCLVNFKIVLENPLEIHYVTLEVADVNDHAPSFPEREIKLEITESALPGARFQLQAARDPDSVSNSVQTYKLSHNDHFRIEVKDRDERKMPYLILQKPLDRESVQTHKLVLSAVDGGRPPMSGTMEVTVDVLDINDNTPVFTQDSYSVTLDENSPVGTTVMQVNATDPDDGPNGEVFYMFGNDVESKVRRLFDLNSNTGEILVKENIDFEKQKHFEFDIKASDRGLSPLISDKSVRIKVMDLNDNAPEIEVTSFSNTISEDSIPGTTVGLISVSDLDSGINGKIVCSLNDEVPFKLMPTSQDNIYSLITKSPLDREKVPEYKISLTAEDSGQPALSSKKTITILLSDVNDNSPEFSFSPYTFYVLENNVPGEAVFSVSASDQDMNENAVINYQICRDCSDDNKFTSFININSENGNIYALKTFDFETVKTFQFYVLATDSGRPPLSSNVTVKVFILDQNDNAPVILSPVGTNSTSEAVEEIPRNVNAGHLVTKVRAYDADVGYNGWLLFSLQEISDHTLFGLDRYTGQIRTLRLLTESDEAQHKLVVLVKDNGNVSLSATVTIIIKAVEPKEAFAASDVKNTVKEEEESSLTFYLIVTLGTVSVLFLLSVIVLGFMQCSKSPDHSSKYLQEANYDGTLCHSIQYRSGDKRYMLVGPRMSIGSTIVPGSNGNTLIVPNHRRRLSGEDCVYPGWILQHRASQAHSHTGMHADG
ncbi:protocadherin alpha-8-like isoform X8 [Denticeps clupeoides]|uniref:protocadherin alpha-8-like isoform X8 n=1 Tax=Denticeps clupeoides TaxID=299321 RepID=UPI0010A4AF92|nr:protocadherin alpha-8-like isoform X8 [Denticeps clupeoides]